MTASVLVVCTANQCRSPLGQALLAEMARRQLGGDSWDVTSAGTHAQEGMPAADESIRLARRWGQDLSKHAARQLDRDMVTAAGLVVTMERAHHGAVLRLAPRALPRTFTWLELARLAQLAVVDTSPAPSPAERLDAGVRALHRARPLATRPDDDGDDVADPMGRSRPHHQRMATTLVSAAHEFLPLLMVGPNAGRPDPTSDG